MREETTRQIFSQKQLTMGYHTQLRGVIKIFPCVAGPKLQYLQAFTNTRHARVNVRACGKVEDPLRLAVGLPAGMWTIVNSFPSPLVLSYNCPCMAPSYNCPWQIYQDGSAISWNKIEKPKAYDAWLQVLATLMKFWGHNLRGNIQYEGEDLEHKGTLKVDTTMHPIQWTQTSGRALMSGSLICETTPHVGHWKSLVMQSLELDDTFWSSQNHSLKQASLWNYHNVNKL